MSVPCADGVYISPCSCHSLTAQQWYELTEPTRAHLAIQPPREADEDADPAFESEGDEYEEAAEDEAPVVLEPLSPLPAAVSPAERLLNAGRVLVRQGRAAVSVLQQELDMEFDEACALLDQLQEEGLIGPYKGGKKRDILLSEEEWEDHFARS